MGQVGNQSRFHSRVSKRCACRFIGGMCRLQSPGNVRFVRHTGKLLLTLRISGFDPKRRFATVSYCIARGSFALDDGCLGQKRDSPNGRYGIFGLLKDQSGFAPANLTTLPHFSVSSAISLPKSAGEPGSTVPP